MSDPEAGGRAGRGTAGQVVVITGASSGIGLATAQLLAAEGARLVLAGRSELSLRRAQRDCREAGAAETLTVLTDVLEEDQVERLAAAAVEHFGRIDAWVHTAAVVAYGRFEDVPAAVFRRVVDTGVHGTAHVARAALRRFRQQGAGTLVLTGSLLGEIVTPYMSSYVTSKWAVRALARALSIETRDQPAVRVCVVSPGGVDTPVYLQAANYAGRVGRPPPPVDPPRKVARAVVRSLHHPKDRRSVGWGNPVARLGFTVTPALFDLLVGPLMRMTGLSRQRVAAQDGNVFRPQPELEEVQGRWGRRWTS